jgi:hypothetical protein
VRRTDANGDVCYLRHVHAWTVVDTAVTHRDSRSGRFSAIPRRDPWGERRHDDCLRQRRVTERRTCMTRSHRVQSMNPDCLRQVLPGSAKVDLGSTFAHGELQTNASMTYVKPPSGTCLLRCDSSDGRQSGRDSSTPPAALCIEPDFSSSSIWQQIAIAIRPVVGLKRSRSTSSRAVVRIERAPLAGALRS